MAGSNMDAYRTIIKRNNISIPSPSIIKIFWYIVSGKWHHITWRRRMIAKQIAYKKDYDNAMEIWHKRIANYYKYEYLYNKEYYIPPPIRPSYPTILGIDFSSKKRNNI